MSESEDTLPEGIKSSTNSAAAGKRCPAQLPAAEIVARQLDRVKEKLLSKKLIPLFAFELYLLNCELHDKPSHHIDLMTSGLEHIGPDGLPHVINAMENLLKALKSRME